MSRSIYIMRLGIACASMVAFLALAAIGSAAQFQVTSTADAGTGTLRQAIADASSGDTITFAAGGQGDIYLDSALTIDKTLTIAGGSSDNVVISGGFITDLIHVTNDASLTLSGLTLTEGFATSPDWAAVLTNTGGGTVTLDHVVVANNIAEVNLLGYLSSARAAARVEAFRRATEGLDASPLTNADIRGLDSLAPSSDSHPRASVDLPDLPDLPVNFGCLLSASCLAPGVSVIWSGYPYVDDYAMYGSSSKLIIRNSTITNNDATGGIVDSVSGPGGVVDVSGTTFSGNNRKPYPGLYGSGSGLSLTLFVLPTLVVSGSSPVTITKSAFDGNSGLIGSAVAILGSGDADQPVAIRDSSFTSNDGVIFGPLVVAGSLGTVTISGSEFSANAASSTLVSQLFGSYGGGAMIIAAHTAIDNTRFTDNAATFGGALIVGGGEFAMTSSTVARNHALYIGGVAMGAVVPIGSDLLAGSITNSTIAENTQTGFIPGVGAGGLAVAGDLKSLTNTTITGNSGGAGTGGLWLGFEADTSNNVVVRNSIISGNHARDGANMSCSFDSGLVVLQGANLITPDLISNFPCIYDTTEHLLTADPKLGTLGAYNWGTSSAMSTVPLLAGSPAIDAALGATPATDERGVARTQGAAADLGAYEARPAHLSLSVTAPETLGVRSSFDYSVVAANDGDLGATGISLSSQLPGFVKYVSATGMTCTGATAVLTCPVGNLESGASTTSTVIAKAIAPGAAVATWTLTAPGFAPAIATTTTNITTSEAPIALYSAKQTATGLTFRVHSSTGGSIQVSMGPVPAGRSSRPAMCTGTKRVRHAATTTVVCRFTRTARRTLRDRAARALATISFTPTVGAKTTVHQHMRLRRLGTS